LGPYLESNLEVLRGRQPDLAEKLALVEPNPDISVVRAKNGLPVMLRQGISLHSRQDPEAEARRFIEVEPVRKMLSAGVTPVVFGLGMGYHVRALSELFSLVVVYESDPGVIIVALSLLDWRDYLPRIRFAIPEYPLSLNDMGALEFLIHRPSQRLDPEGCALAQAMVERKKAIRPSDAGINKIMVVTPVCGGSLPISRHAAHALSDLGHEVVTADMTSLDTFYQRVWRARAAEGRQAAVQDRLMAFAGEYITFLAETEAPDLVLALAQAPLNRTALQKLRALGIPTAFWFVEDYRLMTYFRSLAPFYDYFFHIQGRAMETELTRLGLTRFLYLPLAADPDVFKPIDNQQTLAPYRADLSFMGAGYPNRRAFFTQLLDYDLKIWGTEWDLSSPLGQVVQDRGRRVSTEETVLIYNAARINLNLHSSIFSSGLDNQGDFVNPRTFEVASCGAFQLVDKRRPLEKHFEPEKEIVTFHNIEDLKEKIDYYSDHPQERKNISQKARNRVLSQHTYHHRMKTMLDYITHHAA
jgi:spore maturation protein CgeB